MSMFTCAPASIVHSSPIQDARLLTTTTQALEEQALFLFSATQENSSIIVNGSEAGSRLFDWFAAQDEKTRGTLGVNYAFIPFEIEKISPPQAGSVIISNDDNEAVVYTLTSPRDGNLYFNRTAALNSVQGVIADLEDDSWKESFLGWRAPSGGVFSFHPGLTLVLEDPAFVLMFSTLASGQGNEPRITDAGKHSYVKEGESSCSLIGYTSAFSIDKCMRDGTIVMSTDETSFALLLMLEGDCTLSQNNETIHAGPGMSVLIPANETDISITGHASFVIMHLI